MLIILFTFSHLPFYFLFDTLKASPLQCPLPFTHVTTQPDMTAPLLHPDLSSNEPAIIRPTQRDTLRLSSFVAVIQATALLHRKAHSCREQSISINLE